MCSCTSFVSAASLLLILLLRDVEAQANVCLILYQMADNNLEQFLRQDNNELIRSPAIRQKSLTTWVYFDGRNYRGDFEDISKPLADVFNADGSPVTVKETGSSYLTWNHTMQKMVVERTLTGEVNGDNPQVVYNFVTTALRDCITRGSTEYMIIFASHGGGFDGFGGDENPSRRRLIQSNVDLAAALSRALNDVPSAPSKFDVLGFDACLMQAFDVADDYGSVAKLLLASESIEPGHGWAYNYLDTVESASAMALNFYVNFLNQMQGYFHETPKTMALVDTQAFATFLQAWEALSAEFNALLGKDLDFIANLRRARSNSLAFESVVDFPGTGTPSAVDIGDFLFQLQTLCVPYSSSKLASLMTAAQTAYDDMFVARGVGPGTPPATGMHITWPLLTLYQEDPTYFDPLFDTSLPSTTTSAPNFLEFLWNYFNSEPPAFTVSSSVCTATPCGSLQPEYEGQLLLNPLLIPSGTESTVISLISCTTDQVSVEFGIDLTTVGSGRRLRELFASIKPLQGQTEDKFIFYGGNVRGVYDMPSFSATWNGKFFLISDDTSLDFVYVEDYGDGFKKVPVVYFPSSNPVTSNDIPTGTFLEEAFALGGVFGYLYFIAYDSDTIFDLALYTESAQFGTLSQTPFEAGGFISPIVYAGLNGVTESFVGGLLETVIPWGTTHTLKFVTANAETVAGLFGVSTITLNMIAYDYDVYDFKTGAGVDYASFAIDIGSSNGPTPALVNFLTEAPLGTTLAPSSFAVDEPEVLSSGPSTMVPSMSPTNDTRTAAVTKESEAPSSAATTSFLPSTNSPTKSTSVGGAAFLSSEPSMALAEPTTNASSALSASTKVPTSRPSEQTADCEFYERCADRNLTGQCCDTIDGWTLDCCSPGGSVEAQCEMNPVCASLTLTGQCCPTTDEKWLDCCQAVSNECHEAGACEMYSSTQYLMELNAAKNMSFTSHQDSIWSLIIATFLLSMVVA